MNACVHAQAHTHTHTHKHACVCMCTHIQYVHTYVHTNIYVMHSMGPKFSQTDKKMQLNTLTPLVSFSPDFCFKTFVITETKRKLQSKICKSLTCSLYLLHNHANNVLLHLVLQSQRNISPHLYASPSPQHIQYP